MIRKIIEQIVEDGVMPPYGFFITPEERDYLNKYHPLFKGKLVGIDEMEAFNRKEPSKSTTTGDKR